MQHWCCPWLHACMRAVRDYHLKHVVKCVNCYVCTSVYSCACVRVRECVRACMRACIRACMCVCVHTYVSTCVKCACVHACMRLCLRSCSVHVSFKTSYMYSCWLHGHHVLLSLLFTSLSLSLSLSLPPPSLPYSFPSSPSIIHSPHSRSCPALSSLLPPSFSSSLL